MPPEAESELSGLGRAMKANKGLVALAALAAVAGVIYWQQRQGDARSVIHALIRAGASVEQWHVAKCHLGWHSPPRASGGAGIGSA